MGGIYITDGGSKKRIQLPDRKIRRNRLEDLDVKKKANLSL
jgi:hypothetical protein